MGAGLVLAAMAAGAFLSDAAARHLAARFGAPGTVLDERLTIACNTGAIRPTLLQRAGRGAMPAADLLRGFPIPAGTLLS